MPTKTEMTMGKYDSRLYPRPLPEVKEFAWRLACALADVPTKGMLAKIRALIECRGDLPAEQRRSVVGALRALAKRATELADQMESEPSIAGGERPGQQSEPSGRIAGIL